MNEKHYTITHKSPVRGGIDYFACKYCNFLTHLPYRFNLHMEAFHPEKLHEPETNLKKDELIEIAKENGLAIRGTKAELLERLEGIV